MADKDKYADEMLTDEELDKVAGGARYYPTSISCITPNTANDSNLLSNSERSLWPDIR